MNEQIVKDYLDNFFSADPDFQAIRELLSDVFTFRGPLLKADSADEYISKIQGVASDVLSMKNPEFISKSNQVSVLYDMVSPLGEVRTVEWFNLEGNRIISIELLNDLRIFVKPFRNKCA